MEDILYKLDKTPDDISKLLERHKGLVYRMLTDYGQLQNPDAESAAWEGLWDAINLFDVFSTNAFSTFACHTIKNRIGDVLRKQNSAHKKQLQYMYETQPDPMVIEAGYFNIEDEQFLAKFKQDFELYISRKSGVTKAILMAWYSMGFSTTATNIAAACNCSSSFVSRVQCDFRAYLSGKIKG